MVLNERDCTPVSRAGGADRERRCPSIAIEVHDDVVALERDWREFERHAECTVFQTFDWLSTWQRHIGASEGIQPGIVVGRHPDGSILFLLPLATRSGVIRRLTWLGSELCDYNAPLLAADFRRHIAPGEFGALWPHITTRLQQHALLRHDLVELVKMPEMVGSLPNPFLELDVDLNPSGAHLARLHGPWNEFYVAKRSSKTRRRDRTKRDRMAQHGDIRFVTPQQIGEVVGTVEILMEQKSQALVEMGVPDLFARPAYRQFFVDMASHPASRHLVHVSRLEVGSTCVAANFGMIFRGRYYHVLASRCAGELARYGPGAAHLRELLRHAIECDVREFDFTIGDERYKLEWSDVSANLFDHVAAANARGSLVMVWTRGRHRAKRVIKQNPVLWNAVRNLRARVGRLSGHGIRNGDGAMQPDAEDASQALANASNESPLACVMGGMDVVRPLALAGIRSIAVARPGSPALYSRCTQARIVWNEFSPDDTGLVDALMRVGAAQPERPVLFFQEDAQLLLVSRHRERLGEAFRFVIADPTLIEDLVDKTRFIALAERLELPAPRAVAIDPARPPAQAELGLRFPVIVKPATRTPQWDALAGRSKALRVDSPERLKGVWSRLLAAGVQFLVQELVAGPETRGESYHVYVDSRGDIVADFTGRKIRTHPVVNGHSTALEISDAADVLALGRTLVPRLGLRGVAKFDFKRGPDGKLHLLEINPRFSLWHHLGAAAGVNLPLMVYADLTGRPRPRRMRARPGTRWCSAWRDFAAARAAGVPMSRWLPWALGCEAKSAMAWDDPMPFIRACLARLPASRARREHDAGSPQACAGLQ